MVKNWCAFRRARFKEMYDPGLHSLVTISSFNGYFDTVCLPSVAFPVPLPEVSKTR